MHDLPRWRWVLWPALALTLLGTITSVLGHLDVGRLLFPGADKLLHFLLYGGVTFGAMGWLAGWRGRSVLALFATIAIADELSQRFQPNRTVDLADGLCSLAGIFALGLLARALRGEAQVAPRDPPKDRRTASA